MTQNHDQMTQNHDQMTQNHDQMTQNHDQMTQNHDQMTQNHAQMTQNLNHVKTANKVTKNVVYDHTSFLIDLLCENNDFFTPGPKTKEVSQQRFSGF
jgi:hypothetical protein